uniref:Non-haem dioxygenase N-terminal domain-containing protein n=1 Tax=Emiliania huxleyi TaxID=2903 RepID=A0A7S3WDJ5_EMIHU
MCKRNSPPIPAFDPPPTKQRATDSPCEAEAAGADKSAAREVQLERQLLQAGGKGGSAAVYGNVPVVDLSLPDDEVRAAMIAAASEVGFFSVTNHGIPEAAIDEAFGASATFFGQERAAKAEQAPFAAHLNCGYEYMSQVRPSTGTPDQKESLQVTARRGSMDGRWPSTDGRSPPRATSGISRNLAQSRAIPRVRLRARRSHTHQRGALPRQQTALAARAGGLPAPARRHARGGAHALGGGRAVHAAAAALPAGGRVECARGLLARRPAHGLVQPYPPLPAPRQCWPRVRRQPARGRRGLAQGGPA